MTDEVSTVARSLRILWLAICAGAAMIMVVLGGLAASSEPIMPEYAAAAFYGVAVLSMVATAGAFAFLRSMEDKLSRAGSDAEAAGLLRTYGVVSLALAEVPTIVGSVAAFVTGELLTLAFAVPLFAYAWLTWPSDDRVGTWLALRRR